MNEKDAMLYALWCVMFKKKYLFTVILVNVVVNEGFFEILYFIILFFIHAVPILTVFVTNCSTSVIINTGRDLSFSAYRILRVRTYIQV